MTTTPEHDKLNGLRDLNGVAADIAQLLLDSDGWQLVNTGAGPAVTVGVKRVVAEILDIDIDAWQLERLNALGLDTSNRKAFGVLASLAYADEAARLPTVVETLDSVRAAAPDVEAGGEHDSDRDELVADAAAQFAVAEEDAASAAEPEHVDYRDVLNATPHDRVYEVFPDSPGIFAATAVEPADYAAPLTPFFEDETAEPLPSFLQESEPVAADPILFVDEEARKVVVFDEPAVESQPVPSIDDAPEPVVDTVLPPVPVAPVIVVAEDAAEAEADVPAEDTGADDFAPVADEPAVAAEPEKAPAASKSAKVKSFLGIGNYDLFAGTDDEDKNSMK